MLISTFFATGFWKRMLVNARRITWRLWPNVTPKRESGTIISAPRKSVMTTGFTNFMLTSNLVNLLSHTFQKSSIGTFLDLFLQSLLSYSTTVSLIIKCSLQSGDLNSKLVLYLNGPKQFVRWMVCYSNHVLNSKLYVCISLRSRKY